MLQRGNAVFDALCHGMQSVSILIPKKTMGTRKSGAFRAINVLQSIIAQYFHALLSDAHSDRQP